MAEQNKVDARIVDAEALEREAREANQALQQERLDPFGGDSVSIEVTKQVNTAQFQDEISHRAGRTVQVALLVDDPSHIASKDKPGALYISPKTLGERLLREAYEAHTAKDEDLPQPPAPDAPQKPALSEEAAALLEKVREGKALTAKELTVVVASLAGIETDG